LISQVDRSFPENEFYSAAWAKYPGHGLLHPIAVHPYADDMPELPFAKPCATKYLERTSKQANIAHTVFNFTEKNSPLWGRKLSVSSDRQAWILLELGSSATPFRSFYLFPIPAARRNERERQDISLGSPRHGAAQAPESQAKFHKVTMPPSDSGVNR
jgi:hypothetical protein